MAKICMVLTAPTMEENKKILERNLSLVDMVELRTDLLETGDYPLVSAFPSQASVPVVLTCRKECDGGSWTGPERERLVLMTRWLEGGFAFVDLEMDLDAGPLETIARKENTKIIRSFHNFKGVPADLKEIMSRHETVIAKGAVYPRSSEDLFRLVQTALEMKKARKSPFILLGMGEFGFPTRILAEKLGSWLTFCSDSGSPSGAPGHCTAEDLNKLYRFRKIGEGTTINSIIGNPVSQSRSPHLHNRWYEEKGLDAVYVPFLTDSPQWFMKTADLLGINGSSVTVPFKSEIIAQVEHTDQAVDAIGASNTIFRDSDGLWAAANTDVYGLIQPLLDLLGVASLQGVKAAVIGAGGAARAAVFALRDKGAEVAVFNRTKSRAEELAMQLDCAAYSLESDSIRALKEYRSIIVQTSSAGMPPLEDVDPLAFYDFDGSEVVYDIIYKPEVTKLMARAKEAGCQVIGGFKMLEEQALLQFDFFRNG